MARDGYATLDAYHGRRCPWIAPLRARLSGISSLSEFRFPPIV